MCLDWENKLKQYVKKFALRKKRKFCLEHFQQNVDNTTQFENDKHNEEEDLRIEENFTMLNNENEINIKHEFMQVKDSG